MTIRSGNSRSGLTLIEIMVALTMTLIVLGSMMAAFRFASSEMANGRSMIELTNQLQGVEKILGNDLDGMTVEPRPYTERTFPMGDFEYLEGPMTDATVTTFADSLPRSAIKDEVGKNKYIGDLDDVLHFTTRSKDVPFKGRYVNPATGVTEMVESSQAEIIYFALHNDRNPPATLARQFFDVTSANKLFVDYDENVSLYRRVLLIRPDLATDHTVYSGATAQQQVDQFFQVNDISTRVIYDTSSLLVTGLAANSLEDLSVRRNRFCHSEFIDVSSPPPYPRAVQSGFPNHLDKTVLANRRMKADPDPAADFSGEDILLTNVAAFDVRVFSPNAQVDSTSMTNGVISPGDPKFVVDSQDRPVPAALADGPRIGAYVDLGYAFFPALAVPIAPEFQNVVFAGIPNQKSQLAFHPINGHAYDIWSPWYENNGEDEDGVYGVDQGVNGFDELDTSFSPARFIDGVDDNLERETMPPYGHPIRGLQVTLRVVEKINNRVEQSSITQSFVPE